MASNYAWIITQDNMGNDKGLMGPKGCKATPEMIKSEGKKFRLLDDDGEIYCYGYFIDLEDNEGLGESAFSPLDDYGEPSLGATDIQYKNKEGEYESL